MKNHHSGGIIIGVNGTDDPKLVAIHKGGFDPEIHDRLKHLYDHKVNFGIRIKE